MVIKKTPPSMKMPRGIPSTTPKKLPRATIKTPVTTPSLKGKSRTPKPLTFSPAERARIVEMNANRTTPKKDIALPPLKTTMTAKPRMPAPRMPAPRFMSTGEPSSKNYVQRSPREDIGMPGTSKFVQRAPRENIGMPNSSKFVRRTR